MKKAINMKTKVIAIVMALAAVASAAYITVSAATVDDKAKQEWEIYQKSDEHKMFMDELEAGQNALTGAADQIGEGTWKIVSTEKAVSPEDGFDCWKVGVINSDDPNSPTYYFYCGTGFCIMEKASVSCKTDTTVSAATVDAADEENKVEEAASEEKTNESTAKEEWEEYQKSEEHKAFMESQEAGQLALEVAAMEHGEGMWMIFNVEETEYEGQKCWGFALKNNDEPDSNGYYYCVGDDFCMCAYEIRGNYASNELVSLESAKETVLERAAQDHGEGTWEILSSEIGEYNGNECRLIEVVNTDLKIARSYTYAVGQDAVQID